MGTYTVGEQNNPLPFPHEDSEIYFRRLYISSKSGLFGATCNKQTKYPVSTRPEKIWDAPVLGISASYGALALAAGAEGLFEYRVIQYRGEDFANRRDPARISHKHCVDCSWAFCSVFGSSSLGTGFLAAYQREQAVEFNSGVVVIPSAGPSIFIRGEPVNWRVFPKSRHYENQLHVIYDDCLEILPFNQDYLVDQQRKVSGIRYYSGLSSGAPQRSNLGMQPAR
jgi:hypothetical protein